MTPDVLLPHIQDAITLYDLKSQDVFLMTLILHGSEVLQAIPPADGARLLRALAHTLDALAEERAKVTP